MANIGPEEMPVDPFDEDEIEELLKPDSDPGVTAFLDQQEAEFAQEREAFRRIYGFDHDCHCSQDYTDGNTETVTKCFLTMTAQAMARSAQATQEIHYLTTMLERVVGVTNDLVGMMEEAGMEKELQSYFTGDDDPEEDGEVLDLEAVEEETEDTDDESDTESGDSD